MQRVYIEPLSADSLSVGETEDAARETLDRLLERAAPEFNAPIRVASVGLTVGVNGDAVLVVLVEETETGFRPLGT